MRGRSPFWLSIIRTSRYRAIGSHRRRAAGKPRRLVCVDLDTARRATLDSCAAGASSAMTSLRGISIARYSLRMFYLPAARHAGASLISRIRVDYPYHAVNAMLAWVMLFAAVTVIASSAMLVYGVGAMVVTLDPVAMNRGATEAAAFLFAPLVPVLTSDAGLGWAVIIFLGTSLLYPIVRGLLTLILDDV